MTHREPIYSACRALLKKGVTGKLEIWADHSRYMIASVDIERGAKLTIQESDCLGPRTRAFEPFKPEEVEK